MITFIDKYNSTFDEGNLSDAVEWYARLKGFVLHKEEKLFFAGPYGYLCVATCRHKPMFVHRLLMMHHLGRELKSDEWVHHRDENILNNVLSNLKLMSDVEHGKHHSRRADIPDSEIMEMLARGTTKADIARYFECSWGLIYRRIREYQRRNDE